jgi:hypothetical protein
LKFSSRRIKEANTLSILKLELNITSFSRTGIHPTQVYEATIAGGGVRSAQV